MVRHVANCYTQLLTLLYSIVKISTDSTAHGRNQYNHTYVKIRQYGGVRRSRDLLKFGGISANISETVQDRDIGTMED